MTLKVQHPYFSIIVPHVVLGCCNESAFESDHQSGGAKVLQNHIIINYQFQSPADMGIFASDSRKMVGSGQTS
jgi:hypothetical protein